MIPAIPALISGKFALGLGAAGLIAVLGTGAWGTTMLIQRNLARAEAIDLSAKLKQSAALVDELRLSLDECSAATSEQNAAIGKLEAAAAEEERKRQGRAAAAKKDAERDHARAQDLAQRKPPPGKDLCTAARELVDEELRLGRQQ